MYTAPAPSDKMHRYPSGGRRPLALRPVYARYGADDEHPEPEDAYNPAPAPSAYTDEVCEVER